MDYYSIIPPLAAILGAAATKKIIPSLLLALFAGTIVKAHGDFLAGILSAGIYLAQVVANEDHAYIILFLFGFGALTEMFKAGGGISGFAKTAAPFIHSEKGALASVFLATPISFLDCCFHAIATGTISKPLLEKVGGSKDKLAFIINTTSSQLVALIPFATTYVGYILGVIGSSLAQAGLTNSPYALYLQSFWLNFYSLIMVLFSLLVIAVPFDLSMLQLAQPAYKSDQEADGSHHSHEAHEESSFSEKVPPRLINLLGPLTILLGLIIYFFWSTGSQAGGSAFVSRIMHADSEKAIFAATLATVTLTSILYALQKIPMGELQSHFLSGGTEMLPPIVVLILAWAIANVTQALGFNAFVGGLLSQSVISPHFLPFVIFVIGGLASYFMGSSWGTWALVMPLGISLAAALGASLPLTVGAVLAGGSIGDNLSPLGETPIETAAIMNIPVTSHIRFVFPYGVVAILLSALLYIVLGYF